MQEQTDLRRLNYTAGGEGEVQSESARGDVSPSLHLFHTFRHMSTHYHTPFNLAGEFPFIILTA